MRLAQNLYPPDHVTPPNSSFVAQQLAGMVAIFAGITKTCYALALKTCSFLDRIAAAILTAIAVIAARINGV